MAQRNPQRPAQRMADYAAQCLPSGDDLVRMDQAAERRRKDRDKRKAWLKRVERP